MERRGHGGLQHAPRRPRGGRPPPGGRGPDAEDLDLGATARRLNSQEVSPEGYEGLQCRHRGTLASESSASSSSSATAAARVMTGSVRRLGRRGLRGEQDAGPLAWTLQISAVRFAPTPSAMAFPSEDRLLYGLPLIPLFLRAPLLRPKSHLWPYLSTPYLPLAPPPVAYQHPPSLAVRPLPSSARHFLGHLPLPLPPQETRFPFSEVLLP